MKKHYGLLQIKKKGTEKKFLNKEQKKDKQVYDDEKVKFLIVKYKKFENSEDKNKIIELCYPIIFAVLKTFGKKINTTNCLLDHEDLFNEGVLIVDRCINSFDIEHKSNVKFSTFIWTSLYRGFIRFIDNNLLKPNNFFSSNNLENEDNNMEEELETLKHVKGKNAEKEVKAFLKANESFFMEEDAFVNLTKIEKKFLFLRFKKYDIEEIKKILDINNSKYYKILNSIKKKVGEDYESD